MALKIQENLKHAIANIWPRPFETGILAGCQACPQCAGSPRVRWVMRWVQPAARCLACLPAPSSDMVESTSDGQPSRWLAGCVCLVWVVGPSKLSRLASFQQDLFPLLATWVASTLGCLYTGLPLR